MALIERPSGVLGDLPESLVVGKMASPRPASKRRATPGIGPFRVMRKMRLPRLQW